MKKSLLLAASFLAVAALAGCTEDTDDTSSSSNDIVTGDPREDGTGAAYGQKPEEAPLPEAPSEGADGTITAQKLVAFPHGVNLKPVLEFPKPPVEAKDPSASQN